MAPFKVNFRLTSIPAALLAQVMLIPQPIACRAATLVYLSSGGVGENVAPASPHETFEFPPAGGSFHIWIRPDALLTGVSLDLTESGAAVRFTDVTVHNPAIGGDSRWLPALIREDGVADGKITRIEGGAITGVPTYGRGIGPATAAVDPLYETSAGFLFATIDFVSNNSAAAGSVSLSIGRNRFGDANGLASDPILLGVGDGPVSNVMGATGSVVDLLLTERTILPADFNASGQVDGADLMIWQRGHGLASGATQATGDATADGAVDHLDLAAWQTQFGALPAVPAASPIPEPSAAMLLAITLAAAAIRFARRRGICYPYP